jgi:hypothetical protein
MALVAGFLLAHHVNPQNGKSLMMVWSSAPNAIIDTSPAHGATGGSFKNPGNACKYQREHSRPSKIINILWFWMERQICEKESCVIAGLFLLFLLCHNELVKL